MKTLKLFFAGILISFPTVWGVPVNAVPSTAKSPSTLVSPLNRLKSGDRIRITVLGFPDLSGDQLIPADGTLQLPLVGVVTVAGLTPAEAISTITGALRPYVRRPQVGLAVVNLRAPRISVTGEVVRPGPRLLVPPTVQSASSANASTNPSAEDFQTLSYALVLAGGVTPNADLRNIIIRRVVSSAADISIQTNSSKTESRVDLWQTIQRGDLTGDPRLADGDEIVVPTASISRGEQHALLSSTVSPTSITVQIAGEVYRPGTVQVSPTAGVSTAVAAAGGPTDKAQAKSMTLLRLSPDGRLERQTFAFGDNTIAARDGDVIVVSKAALNKFVDTLGTILNPLTLFRLLVR